MANQIFWPIDPVVGPPNPASAEMYYLVKVARLAKPVVHKLTLLHTGEFWFDTLEGERITWPSWQAWSSHFDFTGCVIVPGQGAKGGEWAMLPNLPLPENLPR